MLRRVFLFIAAIGFVLASFQEVAAISSWQFPKAPSRDLKASFPDCPDARVQLTLRILRVCRVDLEAFRSGVLEPYNVSVHAYNKRLLEYDAMLRGEASKGKISWSSYEEQKDNIRGELQRAEPDGDLMAPYLEYYEKYKKRSKYVKDEIQRCETDPRQPC